MTPPTVTPLRSTWLPTNAAADALGVSRRTLQRRARAGHVETKPGGDGTVLYRVPQDAVTRDVTPRHPVTVTPPVTPALEELRALLAAEQAARIDAERRAAVAEYRVAIAEVDPTEVEALRATVDELEANVAELTTERDQARDQAQALADAMRKRHGLIKRLTARLANA